MVQHCQFGFIRLKDWSSMFFSKLNVEFSTKVSASASCADLNLLKVIDLTICKYLAEPFFTRVSKF